MKIVKNLPKPALVDRLAQAYRILYEAGVRDGIIPQQPQLEDLSKSMAEAA